MKISALNIRIALAEKQMTQSGLAIACGMANQNLSAILSKGSCSPVTAGRIAAALGVNVRDILDMEDE